MVGTVLDRDDIVSGLRELVSELRSSGEIAGIRLVGGAALALRYFDRGSTHDLDALHVRPGSDEAVAAAAARVAARLGWHADWINFEVNRVDAVPNVGRPVEWIVLYDREGIVIEVAAPEALLVMKLRANRPGRDTTDIRSLLAICAIRTLEDAETLYEDFYPGDALPDRALSMVRAILAEGPLPIPPAPAEVEI